MLQEDDFHQIFVEKKTTFRIIPFFLPMFSTAELLISENRSQHF